MSQALEFAQLPFDQPARARANLDLLRQRLPERLLAQLPTVLAQLPDPDAALNYLERFSREAAKRVFSSLARQPALLHYLLALFSHSRFLSETLIQQPEMILWLGREKNLSQLKTKEELLEEYARFETTTLESDPSLALARFKRRQYLRITLKDILGLAALAETTLELSVLADVLLEKALVYAQTELRQRYGVPQALDERGRLVRARFAIVSLGKLGGEELNYSSDIDLLFLFTGEGETSAPGQADRLGNSEFFLRLAQRVLQIVAGLTREGAVFRVDMRLRPGGGEGDLAISLPAAVHYYTHRAREWERQMLLKARPSAGDADLVQDFLGAVHPVLYRGPMHFSVVESVVKAREQFRRKLDRAGHGRLNVKLAPGGIRDIEFLVQCLQRLHGQRDPWVQATGTLLGLQKLYEKGYLAARDHFHLSAAYQFLRLVEHRLQLEQGQQIHTLPEEPAALDLLARRCGLEAGSSADAGEELLARLHQNLRHVRAIYQLTLPEPSPHDPAAPAPAQAEMGPSGRESAFDQVLQVLRQRAPQLSRELERLPGPESWPKPLRQFLTVLSASPVVAEANAAAAVLPRAAEILRLSEPLGTHLLRHPEWMADLTEVDAPEKQVNSSALLTELSNQPVPLIQQMAGLRRFFSSAVFRWGAQELCQPGPIEAGLERYTALVETALGAGLAIAERGVDSAKEAEAGKYAVIGLGRLGLREMDFGSDADLVFLAGDPQTQAWLRRVVEKLIHVLSAYTREGTVFPVDVRLRPRGGEGELVGTADGALDYFGKKAEVWEAATYLKAHPVAGDPRFGAECCQRLQQILRDRFSDQERIRAGLSEMRRRMETEAAKNPGMEQNFKTGPGGVYDLDFLCSAAALSSGRATMAGKPIAVQVELLGAAAGVSEQERAQLQQAGRLFRVVDHGIRLATGRTTAVLPGGPRGEAVAQLTGRWLEEDLTRAKLMNRLEETRRTVRALFSRFAA